MHGTRVPTALLSLSLLALSVPVACRAPDLASVATRPDAVEARQIMDTLAHGDVAAVTARLDESQRTPDPENQLRLLAATFPARAPVDVRVVGYQINVVKVVGRSTTTTSAVTFESKYDDAAYVVTSVVLRSVDDGERRIIGLHAQALPASLEVLNRFSLGDKGFIHYAFLLAMIAVAATIVTALVWWFRRRRVTRHKWWWLLAILVGPFKLTLNWTSGAFAIQALTVQLFGLAAMRDGVGPWILSFSIPAGAIAFLINARRAGSRARQEPPSGPAAAPPADVPPV